ncbi:F0F1 ATP synthase subunit gamma [Falsiroseomonas selenitidurans]|uniref:F0F1 ATP synthase subunit gamma n=1 Tax=Falsiroseomonas selenitidurans TaxID=2716335 RepID=A0ABX1E8S8_9PROT|nr:FoF1 ATP synthase subunit gamma [Falsiroseomonas selenitidurans]NKC33601.1 F0F1 ATP synthase subunit gamma [Falsiroseomonas selenitidurans]
MTERLGDISARIEGIRQLGAVVNAMRGIAAARARQARDQLAAVDSYAASIAGAISEALALAPAAPTVATPGRALVVFCAEQGFAGAFSERVLESVGADLAASTVLLVGTRGESVAAERGVALGWHAAMPAHSSGVPKLADRIASAIYDRIARGDIGSVEVVFSLWEASRGTHVERQRLLPFDATGMPPPRAGAAPLIYLPPQVLLGDLTADFLHAQLCRAALHAFAAENEARMAAMAAARGQIERRLGTLQGQQRRVRQEEITAEIIELAAGETAGRERQG